MDFNLVDFIHKCSLRRVDFISECSLRRVDLIIIIVSVAEVYQQCMAAMEIHL